MAYKYDISKCSESNTDIDLNRFLPVNTIKNKDGFSGISIDDNKFTVGDSVDDTEPTKESILEIINKITKVTDTYPNLDRWTRCVAETENNKTVLKCYGNTDGKLTYPDNIDNAASLFSGNPDKLSAHLTTPLRFSYPKMFKNVNGKSCFNNGCFHFRMRFPSLPDSIDLILAQYMGIVIGYNVPSGDFYMTNSSIDKIDFKHRIFSGTTDSITVPKSDLMGQNGFSIDIAVDDYNAAIYCNKHYVMSGGLNHDSSYQYCRSIIPDLSEDGEIIYADPVIYPKFISTSDTSLTTHDINYDIDDIFIDYTTHKPLF